MSPLTIETLSDLFGTVSTDTFFDEYWEQQPLHVERDDPSFYDRFLTLDQIDAIFANGGVDDDLTRTIVDVESERDHHGGSDVLSGDKMYSAFADGKSSQILFMEQHVDSVQRLVQGMEKLLSAEASANVYLTPSDAQAFGVHFDRHDVFVLQVTGRKHWTVYEDQHDLPLGNLVRGKASLFGRKGSYPSFREKDDDPDPKLEVTLEPGDLLYIPRGYQHEARTADTLSMHLTVGAYPISWHDALVCALSDLLAKDVTLRHALPRDFVTRGGTSDAVATLSDRVVDTVRQHLDAETVRGAVDRLASQFIRSRDDVSPGALQDLNDADGIGPDTRLAVRPELMWRLQSAGETVELQFNGHRLELPAAVEPLLEHITEVETFRVGDLPAVLPEDSRLAVVRFLVKRRFLTLRREGSSPLPAEAGRQAENGRKAETKQ